MEKPFLNYLPFYWLAFAVILTVTAFFSSGYYHPDEHWQILEFLNWKVGRNTDPSYLPWEYAAQIRPTIQPTLAEIFFRCWRFLLGEVNPFHFTTFLRLLSASLFFVATYKLVKSTLPLINPTLKKYFLFFMGFTWFLPFLYVRFSSESWSGSLFALGLSLILPAIISQNNNTKTHPSNQLANQSFNKWTYLGAGILFGFSFIFRYQSGILFGGLFLWILFHQCIKSNSNHLSWRKKLLFISLGFSTIFLLGILIDYRFYGNWNLPSLQYFKTNLIEDKASEFGTSPFYYYFKMFYRSYIPPISVGLLLLLLGSYIKFRQSIFTWISLPFILIHILIPHKEIRFLLPITFYLPISAILFYQYFKSSNWSIINKPKLKLIKKTIKYTLIISFLFINLQLLFYKAIIPLRADTLLFQTTYSTKNTLILYVNNPYLTSFYQRNSSQRYVPFPTLKNSNNIASPSISQAQLDTLKNKYLSFLNPPNKKKNNISTVYFIIQNRLDPKVLADNKITQVNNPSLNRLFNLTSWFSIDKFDIFNWVMLFPKPTGKIYLYRVSTADFK